MENTFEFNLFHAVFDRYQLVDLTVGKSERNLSALFIKMGGGVATGAIWGIVKPPPPPPT